MGEDEQAAQVRRELSLLQRQMHDLRVLVLRVPAVLAVGLIAVGSFLPIWHEEPEGGPRTPRMISAGFQAFGGGLGDDPAVPFGIGFTGLLVVLLMLCYILLSSVVGLHGTRRWTTVRSTVSVLAVVGTLVACLLSLIAASSDLPDTSGGPGPYVVLAGVALGVAVVSYGPWHVLWVDATPRANAFRSF